MSNIDHRNFPNKDTSPAGEAEIAHAKRSSARWDDDDWRIFGRIVGVIHDEDDEDDVETDDLSDFDFDHELTKGLYDALSAEGLLLKDTVSDSVSAAKIVDRLLEDSDAVEMLKKFIDELTSQLKASGRKVGSQLLVPEETAEVYTDDASFSISYLGNGEFDAFSDGGTGSYDTDRIEKFKTPEEMLQKFGVKK